MHNTKRIYTKNATYQKFEVLLSNRNKRHKYNEFIIEGVLSINEAVKNDWQISSFIYSHEKKPSRWAADLLLNTKTIINYELPQNLMDGLSGKNEPSELMAIVRIQNGNGAIKNVNNTVFSKNPVIALFDRPSNKGNLGTLIRSCSALGVEQLIITGHCVDIYDIDVINASRGSFFSLPFLKLSANSEIDNYITGLKSEYPNLKTIGTNSRDGVNIYDIDLTTPVIFLIGSETDGLNRYLSNISDITAVIAINEQSSVTSFNVSCAATVLFYEAARQRKMACVTTAKEARVCK